MGALLVRDVMTPRVLTVTRDCGYKQVVDLLDEFGISAVPVIDDDRHVLGVVSEADLLHKAEFQGSDTRVKLFDRPGTRAAKVKAGGETAGELMTAPPVTVRPLATVGEAARLMEQRGVKRLPVVDDETGRLVGIVARRDLLRQYLRGDDDIRHDVVDDVLRKAMWIDPLEIVVSVEQGRVVLGGTADRRSTARIAARLVWTVPGVVAVVDRMTWQVDDLAHRGPSSMDVR